MYQERKVCFMLDGKEVYVPIYMNVSSIEQWKQHFIEFVETGEFDKHFYCQVYGDNLPSHVTSKVHKFPMTSLGANKFYCHNPDAMRMLNKVREDHGDAGIETVPKPPQPRYTLVCSNCGSDNVQSKAWVNANTNEYVSECTDGSSEDFWCEDCKGHHNLTSVMK